MNVQKLETPGKWLFGIAVVGGIVFSTNGVEFLPMIVGMVFLTALAGFPDFRRQIRWRRMFLFGAIAMVALMGMYLAVLGLHNFTTQYNTYDPLTVFSYFPVWPLVNYDMEGDVRLADSLSNAPLGCWLLFWMMEGLLFGFIFESFLALSKQRGVKRMEACVRRDSEAEGDVPPFGLVGVFCMACLAAILLATRPLAAVSPRMCEWLLPALAVMGPAATAFATLYRSSWQRELPATRRAVAIILRSGVILVVVSLIVLLIFLVVVFLATQEGKVSRGQYGAF